MKSFSLGDWREKWQWIWYTVIFSWSRIFMSIDLIIWYIRILYFFIAYKFLGPKLVMIYEMVSLSCIRITSNSFMVLYCRGKMLFVIFLCFILILLFGFSIASWSLLTTPEQVTWSNTTNSSFFNVTVAGQDGRLGVGNCYEMYWTGVFGKCSDR